MLFAQAGLDVQTASLVASGVTGLAGAAAATASAYYLVPRIGRRPIFISGGGIMAASLLLIGALYASKSVAHPAGKWTVVALIEVFFVAFSGTWALTVRLYAGEIQPSRTRAAASSFGTGANQAVYVHRFESAAFFAY